jgi:phospholipid-binding lipoprotein MlaA
MTPRATPRRHLALLAASLLFLSACATTARAPGQRLDPWENWNRKVFNFNESLDRNVLKPVATVYHNVLPDWLRNSVGNVFSNVADGWSFVNNVLQGKPEPGLRDLVRFNVNTFFGLGGIIDIASDLGIDHQYEDFGQTLGVWGFGAGAYVVWPLLGPSSVRDSVGLPLDRLATPAVVFNSFGTQIAITSLELINKRSDLLQASALLDEIALDKYTFVRDAYLARRRSMVYDGNPPDQPDPSAPPTPEGSATDAATPLAPAPAPAASGASAPEPAASAASAP